ncbi:DUF192 domain-containing protein [Candidatus Beckwithbacteria bacterium]|nr:DUF192 domain-containing protein [Candidatus Beckwithbacteria bacterium]
MFSKPQIITYTSLALGLFLIWFFLFSNFIPRQKNEIKPTATPEIATSYNHKIRLNNTELMVEIADTPEKQEQGLSGRKFLAEGTGMLFTYAIPQKVIFWMPDMNFPIDIIYLKNNEVVQIEKNVPNLPDIAKEKLPKYPSYQEIDLVLEVPAGWSEKNNIAIGDKLTSN